MPHSSRLGLFYTTSMGDVGYFTGLHGYILRFVCCWPPKKKSLFKHHLCVNCAGDDFPVNIVFK
jgi:hypothetical protein